jgi:hypothetical protein
MFVLYCVGIPAASLYLLRTHKLEIVELQICVYELAEKEEEARKLGGVTRSPARLSGVQEGSVREVRSESDLFADISELPAASKTLEADIKTLRTKQKDILDKNPRLRGLTPLYQDYEAGYYYFEVVQFVVTLFLVAVAVLAFSFRLSSALPPPPPNNCPPFFVPRHPCPSIPAPSSFWYEPLFLLRIHLLRCDTIHTSACFL